MRKSIAAATIAAATLVGGGAIGLASVPMASTAAAPSTARLAAPTANQEQGAPGAPDANGQRPAPKWMTDALTKLVNDKTITQDQANAVSAALEAAKPKGGPGEHRGPGGGPVVKIAASTLGISEQDLRTALQSGQTIAQVAQSKGVEVSKIVDAAVADLKTHLADDVKSGKLTQEQADKIAADAPSHITDVINGKAPMGRRGPGGPGRGPSGEQGQQGQPPAPQQGQPTNS